jgi:hypothetical protein
VELNWTPGRVLQAEDRILRIGQREDIKIKYVYAPGTADFFLGHVLNKKLGKFSIGFTYKFVNKKANNEFNLTRLF